MKKKEIDGVLLLEDVPCFDLAQTFECGQCFRWRRVDRPALADNAPVSAALSLIDAAGGQETAPGLPVVYEGVVGKSPLRIWQRGQNLVFEPADLKSYQTRWADYFDLRRDYRTIQRTLAQDATLARAIRFAGGIRVLRQDFFETLISFILSQQSNIPRIRQNIDRLCQLYGEKISWNGRTFAAFPTPERLARLDEQQIAQIHAGYRGRYILDAARKVAGEEIDLTCVRQAPLAQALDELMKICGVGVKVANCVALFGAGRMEAFPADVWIKRALHSYYGEREYRGRFGPYAGIAQQYLYHLARSEKIG